jgi:hypothetical protein
MCSQLAARIYKNGVQTLACGAGFQTVNGCAAHASRRVLTLDLKTCSLFVLFTSRLTESDGDPTCVATIPKMLTKFRLFLGFGEQCPLTAWIDVVNWPKVRTILTEGSKRGLKVRTGTGDRGRNRLASSSASWNQMEIHRMMLCAPNGPSDESGCYSLSALTCTGRKGCESDMVGNSH